MAKIMKDHLIYLLEEYSQKSPEQVLIIKAIDKENEQEIIIFKGFSSCLSSATKFDTDEPMLSPSAQIINIDIVKSPYNPQNLHYLKRNLTWQEFQKNLTDVLH